MTMGFLIQLWTRGRGPFMFMALAGFFIGITFAWLWLDGRHLNGTIHGI